MSNIKILISCHKDFDIPKSEIMLPIQVGAAISKKRIDNMLYDDDGQNISSKNLMYCELTAQYWAWKNLDSDYYGFCHYRRYFNFLDVIYKDDEWGNIIEDYIDEDAIQLYGFNDALIKNLVEKYDIITTNRKDLRKLPPRFKSIYDQYEKACLLEIKDLECVMEIINDKYPEYIEAAKQHCFGHTTSFCNMYILKKDIFFSYCEWMFDILSEFEKRTDMSRYGQEALRTPGHLSERLFGIFYLQLIKDNPRLKVKELQCVLFEFPEKQEPLLPVFDDNQVVVALAANDNFVPIAATCIQSIIENSSKKYNYDIVMLESDITTYNKNLLLTMIENQDNISLRFFNAARLLKGYNLQANAHISVETYFRFLIQSILPKCDKVLYLDCDLVVKSDIAELYNSDIENYLLGAAYDPDFLGQINGADLSTKKYSKEVLKMKDSYQYFQAGVLLFNIKAMRSKFTLEQWLKFATKKYKYNDQDVLNIYCEGQVKYIDMAWNMLSDCNRYRVNFVIKAAPYHIYQDYLKARNNPKIIHYAGFLKPWHRPDEDLAFEFWNYAKRTPFYELLLFRMNEGAAWHVAYNLDRGNRHRVFRRLTSVPRKIVDIVFPKGTKGRAVLKKIYYLRIK
ncbi:MAG: hypothetical protein K0R57_2116 [Paenibacillaceae bacterium]|jgi:lipopolysaccharide biosynthesis glycosyltransferase|nr:hypothetical protein [Paenibacillaceae bacterium]